jgi:cell division protein ZapA
MTEAMAEDNKDKLHIRLHVYDTEMSVNVVREDEKMYRDAAKLITDTVNTYADVFKGRKSDKDLLYMALIDIALRYEKESTRNDTEPYSDILGKLTSEIEDALK